MAATIIKGLRIFWNRAATWSNMEQQSQPRLAMDLDPWQVRLVGGETIDIWAHGYSSLDDESVFQVLIVHHGDRTFVTVARIPSSIIESVRGG